jgi:hypothetical protein
MDFCRSFKLLPPMMELQLFYSCRLPWPPSQSSEAGRNNIFVVSDWFELGELAGKINGIIVMLRVWCTYSMPGSLSINSQQAPLSIVSDTFFEVFGFSF